MGYAVLTRGHDDLASLSRATGPMIRAALERLFWIWLRKYGPKRFSRQAFYRYRKQLGNSYKTRYKGKRQYSDKYLRMLAARIDDNRDTDKPLVKSGDTMRAFLHGTIYFTGGRKYGHLRATWRELPNYMNRTGKNERISKTEALTVINEDEWKWMVQTFDKLLQKELDSVDHRKTRGRFAIDI